MTDPIHRPKFIERSLAYWRSALVSAEQARERDAGWFSVARVATM